MRVRTQLSSLLHESYCWSIHDTMNSDQVYSLSDIQEMCDYKEMAKREHKRADEVRTLVTSFSGVSCTKNLRLSMCTKYSKEYQPPYVDGAHIEFFSQNTTTSKNFRAFLHGEKHEAHGCSRLLSLLLGCFANPALCRAMDGLGDIKDFGVDSENQTAGITVPVAEHCSDISAGVVSLTRNASVIRVNASKTPNAKLEN